MKMNIKKMESQLKHLKNNQNKAHLKQRLLAQPLKSWKVKSGHKSMIKYSVKSTIDPVYARTGALHSNLTELLNFENGYNTEIKVYQSSGLTRIESGKKSFFGSNFVYIKDKNQGLLYLDQKDKTYLHLDGEQLLKTKYGRLKGEIEEIIKGKKNNSTAILNITYPLKGKQYLHFFNDDTCSDYNKDVFRIAFACPEKLRDSGIDCSELMQLGVLTKGEFLIEKSKNKYDRVSAFEVTGIKLEKFDRSKFNIPDNYDDYRDHKKKQKEYNKKIKFGKTYRIANLRRAKNPFRSKSSTDFGEYKIPDNTISESINMLYPSVQQAVIDRDEGNLKFPECTPSTYGSQVANLVDQKLLDDVKYIVNGISKRLSGFNGSNGSLTLDWLTQFKAHADALGLDAGSGLYHLLRDETVNGTGLLDKLAETEARRLLISGNVSSLVLPAGLLATINGIIADTSILAADRFDNLSNADQRTFRDAFLFQKIGTIQLNYPSSVPTQTVFHGLLNIRVDNIEFDVDIDNSSIMPVLNFENDFIHMNLALPKCGGTAMITRWPTAKYWAYVGLGAVSCFFFPVTCFLISVAATVATFLALDINDVTLDISNLEVDAEIRFLPNANNVLQPDVTLTLDGDVDFSFTSRIPTGIHQLIALIVQVIGNQTDIIMSQLESQIEQKLNEFLKQDLDITYPPKFGPVAFSGLSNISEFIANDRMFIQTRLNAGNLGVINPYITQVDREIKDHLIKMRTDFKATFTDPVDKYNESGMNLADWVNLNFESISRYYLGSVLSQNFINHYIHTLWREGKFTYMLNTSEISSLVEILKPVISVFEDVNAENVRMALWPATSPRTVFTPKLVVSEGRYATTFFDDVRLCIAFRDKKLGDKRIELLFASQLYTEIGFGGVNSGTNKLDLIKIDNQVFDLYFELDKIGIELIHPEIHSVMESDMAFDINYDYSILDRAEVSEAMRLAMHYALKERSNEVIPYASSSNNIHMYDIGTSAIQMLTQFVPFNQNLYISMGTTGPVTAIYEGALDIDTLDGITAQLIRLVLNSA